MPMQHAHVHLSNLLTQIHALGIKSNRSTHPTAAGGAGTQRSGPVHHHQTTMPPTRGASSGGASSGGCPFHHLHKNLAALQQQGNGLLASQPPLAWAALAVAAGGLLALVAYRLVLALFAKRYKVPAKGGAVVITGTAWGGWMGGKMDV